MKNNSVKTALEQIARRGVPEETNLWPQIAARFERNTSMKVSLARPFTSLLIALAALVAFSGAVYALGRTLGYLPGVGLVDSSTDIRILSEPVTATRDGISLTIENALVYPDRVELIYTVDGLPADSSGSDPALYCSGAAGDARLQLPNGNILERDRTGKYPQNVYSMKPVYAASVPAEVDQMTLLLDCLPGAKLGTAPENWSLPFQLTPVPAGTQLGEQVIEVEPTAAPVSSTLAETPATAEPAAAAWSEPQVNVSLTRIVPLAERTIFYFSLNTAEEDPALVSIMPASVAVIDSTGTEIPLIGGFAWQPFEHRLGSEFEYASQTKPADGPLTLVIKHAVAYYAPMYVDPPVATAQEMTFHFNAGENPQEGQTWALNQQITVAGITLKITQARAVTFAEIDNPDFVDGSQGYDYGYAFSIQSDPPVSIQPELIVEPDEYQCWLNNNNSLVPESAALEWIQLCRGGKFPQGDISATVLQVGVLLENTWQVVWSPQ
jgi:hypothetical protein